MSCRADNYPSTCSSGSGRTLRAIMDKFLANLCLHGGALAARLTLGQAFLVHGWSKLSDMATATKQFAAMGMPLPQAAALGAGVVELVGGLLLLLGFYTRWAAGALLLVMAVALLVVHPAEFLKAAMILWPAPGGGLVAIPAWMHVLPLLFLAGWGGGMISLESLKEGLGKVGKGGGAKKDAGDEGKKKPKGK